MSTMKARLRARNRDLIDEAKSTLPRDINNQFVLKDLVANLATLLPPISAEEVQLQRAKQIIDNQSKQPREADDNEDEEPTQLVLDLGGDPHPHDLKRLVKDSAGNIVEEEKAVLMPYLDELARSTAHAARVTLWNGRKAKKVVHFAEWTRREQANGRAPQELTWGNCARETGVLSERRKD